MNNENDVSFKSIVFNGLLKKNPILVGGLVIAPVVVIGNSFMNVLALTLAFSVITFFTLLVSSFVPKNIVFSIRIIMYTFIGSLVYVPSAILLGYLIPDGIEAMGVFFPLLIANGMISFRSEAMFFQESKGHMLLDIIFCILGYDAAVLLYGFIREILGSGTVCGTMIGMPVVFAGFENPFGGFILLGIMAALLRVVLLTIKRVGKAE